MPCRSDHMEPIEREIETKAVCGHIIYIMNCLDSDYPEGLTDSYNNIYPSQEETDKWTAYLCSVLHSFSPEEEDRIVYEARDAESRKLADWWEEHQRKDRERENVERQKQREDQARKIALTKLTDYEKELLGL